MTGVTDAGSMRMLLRRQAVGRTFALALVGRLAYGVLPLCFFFTVREASGSLTAAATSSAAIGLATLAMPVQARLLDRHGQRRILPAYAGCCVLLLVLAGLLALTHARMSMPAWVGLSLALGLVCPALGPAMRAQWREIAPEGPQRRSAYSLDSVCEEFLYLLGPLMAGIVLATGHAWRGLVLAAALITCGTAALVTSPYRPRSQATIERTTSGSERGLLRPLRGLLCTLALFGAGSAATFVGIAASADRAGNPAVAGAIEATMATGAVLGGLLWGPFGATTRTAGALTAALVLLGGAQAVAAATAAHLLVVTVALTAGALATSPVYVIAFSRADALVRSQRRTEASTWVTVGANVGTTAGTTAAGVAVRIGSSAPYVLAAVLTAMAAALALVNSSPKSDLRFHSRT